MTIRMKFNETDRLIIQGVPFRVAEHHEAGITLVQHGNPLLTQDFSYEALHDLLQTSSAVYQRGYYEWSRRRLELDNETNRISDLPRKVAEEILWRELWCLETHERHERGNVKLTRQGIAAAYAEISAAVHEKVLKAQTAKHGKRAGTKFELKTPPKPSTLLEWYRAYRGAGFSVLGLTPKTHRSGNSSKRFCLATEAFIAKSIEDYASPLRPNKAQVAERTQRRIREENRRREHSGERLLAVVSRKTIQRRIGGLDPYYVKAQRYGLAAANRAYAIVENGEPALYPMEQIELDSWQIDLIGLLAQSGVLNRLSAERLSKVERGRRWASIAIDKATRCILACRITEQPSAFEAVRTLEEVTRDKTEIAQAMGCQNPWPFHGGINTVITDQGSEYVSEEFRTTIADLRGSCRFPPAGQPHLRGIIERLFRTFGSQLMPLLAGRTFANPADRGDYDAKHWATLSDDELAQVLITFIVDIYHNQPHDGLAGETPANCWKRLSDKYGVTPPPDGHTRRAVFGTTHKRTVSAGNVVFHGITYTCDELRHHFLHGHSRTVDIRVDHSDLGWISLKIGRDWYPAPAVQKGFDGRSLTEWMLVGQQLRQKYPAEALLTEQVVEDAFRRIDDVQRAALTRQERTMALPSTEMIDLNEKRLFFGVSIVTSQQPGNTPDEPLNDSPLGLGTLIPPGNPTPAEREEDDAPQDPSTDDDWTFEGE